MGENEEICKKCSWLTSGDADNWKPKMEEEKAMFKVGDRVRNKRNGDTGTVRAFKSGEYGIEYDTPNYTHELQSAKPPVSCKENCGRWEKPEYIELIPTLINTTARDSAASALRECADKYAGMFAVAVAAIEKADRPEVVMEAKKGLLLGIVGGLPLSTDTCYFCQVYGFGIGCVKCEYAKHHGGDCTDGESDFRNIDDARKALSKTLGSYYSGESYDPEREARHAEFLRLKAEFEG